jgi:hypothetical protein
MIRTCDLCLRRAALYPLSYGRRGTQCSGAQLGTQIVRKATFVFDSG